MNSNATHEAAEQLARELDTVRHNKIKKIKDRLSSGSYYISPKLLARSLFMAHG